MKKILFASLAVCILCEAATPQGSVGSKLPQPANLSQGPRLPEPSYEAADSFIIGPEDVLAVNVWREPELSIAKIAVRPDGKIGMPLLNEIQASGLTPKQLQEDITEGLKKFVANPNVSVIVVEVRSQVVHILGYVGKPGAYMLGGPLTIVELLARAGGLIEFAKSEDIQVVRKEKGKSIRFLFNYKKFIEGTNFDRNIQLRSGDVVTVP